MVNELAVGYVSIVATTNGIANLIAKELGAAESSAAGYGRRIGAQISKGVQAAKPIDVKELEQTFATAEKSRAATVKRTTTEIEGLRRKEAIAQAQLTEAEGKYAAGSVQVLRAQDRLATASQKVALAVAKQEVEVGKADKTVAAAKQALDDYSAGATRTQSAAARAFSGITSAAGTMARGTGSAIAQAARGDWSGLASRADSAFSTIAAKGNTLGATLGRTIGSSGPAVGKTFTDVGRGIGDTFRQASGDIAGAFGNIKSAASTAAGGVKSAFSKVGDLFGPLIRGGANAGKAVGDSFSSGAKPAFAEAASKAGSTFKSTLGALLTASGISSVLGGIKDAIAGFMPEVMAASDATDKFKSTLKFAGLDTGVIDKLTKSAKSYADRTVYDLADIQDVTAQLAANGVKGFDTLAEAAGNLNAVAGGNAETFSSVGMVLTQTAGQGKLTTENFNQLADAIPGASGMLQKAMEKNGAYTGNFRDAMAKGQITAEEFNQAISDLGMTDAAKEAATATTTLEGAIGNYEATIVSGLSRPLNALKPAITTAIGGVATALGPIFDKLGELVEGIAPRVEGIAKRFNGWAQGFTLDGVTGPLERLRPILDVVRDGVSGFLEGFGGIDELGQSFGPVLGLLTGPLGLLRGALGDVFKDLDFGAVGKTMGQSLKPIVQTLADLGGSLQKTLGEALAKLLPVIGDMAKRLLPVLATTLGAIAPVVAQVVSALVPLVAQLVAQLAPVLVELIAQVMPPIIALIGALVPVILEVVAAVVPLVTQLASALIPVISAVISAVVPLITQLVAGLAPIITMLVQSVIPPLTQILGVVAEIISTVVVPVITFLASFLTGVLATAFQVLTPVVQFVFGVIMAVINTVIGVIVAVIRTGLGLINTNWSNVWNGIKSFLSTIWEGIKSGVTTAINAVGTTISNVMSAISSAWRGAWDGIKSFFAAVWEGIKSGVTTAINAVGTTISNVMSAISSAWRGAWDGIKNVGKAAWDWISSTVGGVFGTMKSSIETTFTDMKTGLGRIWDGIKSVFAKPINAVIRFINDGIIGGYNSVAKVFSMGEITPLRTLPGYARGGILPGVSRYADGDDQLAWMRRGEGVAVSEAMQDPYERKRLLALNKAALAGADLSQFRAHFDGFAGGGLVSYQGKTFTALFASLLERANELGGGGMHITQGGFRPATSYSGTSHRGDAVDIAGDYRRFIAPLRSLGIPTWDRAGKGDWVDHAHGVPLPGSGSAAGSAVWQAQDYLQGGDGLGGRDNGPRGGVIDSIVQGIKGALGAGFSSVSEWFGGITEKLTAPFRALSGSGGGMLGDLVVGIGTKLKDELSAWVKSTLGIGAATGTMSASRGPLLVGERGPEYLWARGGEAVIPATSVDGSSSSGVTYRIGQVSIAAPDWVRDVEQMKAWFETVNLAFHRA